MQKRKTCTSGNPSKSQWIASEHRICIASRNSWIKELFVQYYLKLQSTIYHQNKQALASPRRSLATNSDGLNWLHNTHESQHYPGHGFLNIAKPYPFQTWTGLIKSKNQFTLIQKKNWNILGSYLMAHVLYLFPCKNQMYQNSAARGRKRRRRKLRRPKV